MVIALLLPAGGTVVTILNLQRMSQLTTRMARQLAVAAILIIAIGFLILILLAGQDTSELPADSGTLFIITVGVALASFMAQRAPFRAWLAGHRGTRVSSWYGALGLAIVYQLVTGLVTAVADVVVGALRMHG
ncbi:MAG: hypothetical protein JOZ41_19580 [Chloroflexi bacterium]|nr:hypothetical protein [Chloroflexota bacterium]